MIFYFTESKAFSAIQKNISSVDQEKYYILCHPATKMSPSLLWDVSNISREFSVLMPFGTVVSWYLRSHLTEKERYRCRKFFSSSENAVWLILSKYQEIDVQIQTFTDENWNILHNCFFQRYYLLICRLQIPKISFGQFFVSAPKGSWFSI